MVCCGGDVYILREHGSPRRCGGQGDILAGILGVSMYWASLGNSSILSGGTYSPSSAGLLSSDSAQSWLEFEQSDLHAWRLPNYRGHSNNDPTSASKKQCVSSEVGPLQFELHVAAALFSAAIVRRAAVFAFTDKGRSVTSPDIIECIGRAFTDLVPDGTS